MANQIKFDSKAFRAILVGDGTRSAVLGAAQAIASRGEGLSTSAKVGGYGGGRQIAYVRTTAKDPAGAEQQRESLESAIGG